MKKAACTLAVFACLLSLVLLAVPAFAADSGTPGVDYVPGQVLVQMKDGADPGALCQATGMRVKRALGLGEYLLETSSQQSIPDITAALRTRGDVSLASANYIFRANAIPNDPDYRRQWGMVKINAPLAWDIEKGKSSVLVAVLDTGISMTHPDLKGRVVQGKDFINNDNDASDDAGHGTHVAGIIAASTNNGIGVAGVAWSGVRIMAVKVLGADGSGSGDAIISGINYAMDSGAQVINMSLGFAGTLSPEAAELIHAPIRAAAARGIILVASAGNSSDLAGGTRAPVNYPAAFQECIAVSATQPDDRIANYSCVGAEIDIAAPGGAGGPGATDPADQIYSTFWDEANKQDTYRAESGTSMAAPHVAGACALLLSAGARPSEVRTILQTTARRPFPGSYPNADYGYGIVDVGAAVSAASLLVTLDRPATDTTYVTHNQTPTIRGTVAYADFNTVQLLIDDAPVASVADGRLPAPDPTATVYHFTYQADLMMGPHVVRLVARNSHGVSREVSSRINVSPYRLAPGLRLFSIPYALSPDALEPEAVFSLIGSNFRLARWIPGDHATYAIYSPLGTRDIRAGFNPPDSGLTELPRGLGYWIRILDLGGVDLSVRGTMDDTNAYRIPLQVGWNQIGDPFDFPVDWSSVLVEYQGSTLGVADAASPAKSWIRPTIFRFDGKDYQWANPPNGQLIPWEGHWVKANVPCTLVVPPLPSTTNLMQTGDGSQ